VIDKSKMIDSTGRYLTQGLFYEIEYDHTFAQYTLASNDKEVGGRKYPSIKRLYLEMEDVTEYEFAQTYFVDYPHWQKICNNSQLRKEIDKWRVELELKLRARALRSLVGQAEKGNFNAAKYIAGKEWESKRGRPSKEEKAGVLKKEAALRDELADEASRVVDFLSVKEKKHA
jgi:hypothetical protein